MDIVYPGLYIDIYSSFNQLVIYVIQMHNKGWAIARFILQKLLMFLDF